MMTDFVLEIQKLKYRRLFLTEIRLEVCMYVEIIFLIFFWTNNYKIAFWFFLVLPFIIGNLGLGYQIVKLRKEVGLK